MRVLVSVRQFRNVHQTLYLCHSGKSSTFCDCSVAGLQFDSLPVLLAQNIAVVVTSVHIDSINSCDSINSSFVTRGRPWRIKLFYQKNKRERESQAEDMGWEVEPGEGTIGSCLVTGSVLQDSPHPHHHLRHQPQVQAVTWALDLPATYQRFE